MIKYKIRNKETMSTTIKDIRTNLTYQFDFSSFLTKDEIIASYEVQHVDINLLSDTIEGNTITTILSGGTDGIVGEVSVIILTDLDNTYLLNLFVTVIDSQGLCISETDLVREYTGDIDSDNAIMTDLEINRVLYNYQALDSAKRIYYTVLDSLSKMKAMYAQSGFRSVDKELSTYVEEYGKERFDSICKLYDYYKNNPSILLPQISRAAVRIGGVNRDEYNRVNSNSSGLNGGVFIDSRETTPLQSPQRATRPWRTG